MINVNTFKPGITFQEKQQIFAVISSHSSHQGRGQANVKVKVKNLRTGAITIKTYTGGDKVQRAHIDKRNMDYLYRDEQSIILMHQSTFEQIHLPLSKVKWELNFLKEGQPVLVRQFENEVLDIELPVNVELLVTQAPDAVRGNTQSRPQKRAKLETGYELDVPMFIKVNEVIIVNTIDGSYVGRGGK